MWMLDAGGPIRWIKRQGVSEAFVEEIMTSAVRANAQ
jgi:hypothetical protein